MTIESLASVDSRVQRAFDQTMVDALSPGAIIVGLVYGALAPIYAIRPPEAGAGVLVAFALLTAFVLVGLGLRWRRQSPDTDDAQVLGAFVLGSVLANNALFLALFPEPQFAGTLCAVLLAAGWFFMNLSWFCFFGVATLGAFAVAVVRGPSDASWFGPLMLLVAAGSLAAVVRASRARSLRRIELLRIDNENRTLEQQRAQEVLRRAQKVESLALMAGGIAHDFNNLLTVMIGNAELALEDLRPDDPASGMLRDSIEAGARAGRLTDQLLAYTGRGAQQRELLDLSREVRDTADLLQSSLPTKALLRFDLAEEMPGIEADPGQLQQVLMNLVLNAGQALGDDGEEIHIRTGQTLLSETDVDALEPTASRKPGRYVFLEIEDDGCGMEEHVRDRIFDPFFTTRRQGHGLGLASVLGIAHGHGGGLRVESMPDEGTRVQIFLPASSDPLPVRKQATSSEFVPPFEVGRGTALVIDDEYLVRRMAVSMLRGQGWNVIEAAGGAQGVEAIRRAGDEVRFCLLDMNMPGLSGEETLYALRKVRPDLPVMLTSGYSEVSVARLLEVRGTVFLEKPYRLVTFSSRLRELMGTED